MIAVVARLVSTWLLQLYLYKERVFPAVEWGVALYPLMWWEKIMDHWCPCATWEVSKSCDTVTHFATKQVCTVHLTGNGHEKKDGCIDIWWRSVWRLLSHWGRVMHICVDYITTIVSDNGLSPGRRQAIIWTNVGILLIGPLETNFSEISFGIETFSFKEMHLKMSSAKCRSFCLGLNVLLHALFNGSFLCFRCYEVSFINLD